jgi:alpha-beta hydrolase superfamily lysophospholipase
MPTRPRTSRVLLVLAILLGVVLGELPALGAPAGSVRPAPGWATGAGLAGEAGRLVYERPIEGEVVRGFDPPDDAWGAGHRGVDVAAPSGASVRAAAQGVVAFAGPVAGARWVTIAHADGVRTSYGPLDTIAVARGARVGRGAHLGSLADGHDPLRTVLHWGARRDGAYIDPLSLLDGVRWVPALTDPGGYRFGDEPVLQRYEHWQGRRGVRGALGFVASSPQAEHPGWELAPNPNHVIALAGFGSGTATIPIDVTWLGYDERDVTYLSYAGRWDGSGEAGDPRRDQLPYDRRDTWEGVESAAERLREQLRAQWARSPGQAVDLIGHSMGGSVVAYYLLTMHDPSDPTLPPIGHVATLAAPLEGSDLANALHDAAESRLMDLLLRGGSYVVGAPLPKRDAQAAQDLAVGSDVTADVLDAWEDARDDRYGGPLAGGTEVLTVGGSRDMVVPERRTSFDGSAHIVVPGGHDRMRRTQAGYQVVREFLAGEPVPGEAGGAGHLASYVVSGAYGVMGERLAEAGDAVEVALTRRLSRALRGARGTGHPSPGRMAVPPFPG